MKVTLDDETELNGDHMDNLKDGHSELSKNGIFIAKFKTSNISSVEEERE